MNVLSISGNLGGDAESRSATTGTVITTFSLPAKSGWGDNEKITWVKCVLFGKKGSNTPHGLSEHLTKGRFVAVHGEMVLDEWEYEGDKYYQVKMVCRDVSMGPRTQGDGSGSPPQKQNSSQPESQNAGGKVANDFNDFDDDIPF